MYYILGLISWALVLIGFWRLMSNESGYLIAMAPVLGVLTLYICVSHGINLNYRRFNIRKHEALLSEYWSKKSEPKIDVFLPICDEPLSVLQKTWRAVKEIDYKNISVYVLDDSKYDCDEHKKLAISLGFTYFERPDKGVMKKAGNLKYAYERTSGDFILILDADFAPLPYIIKEMLPYSGDEKVGIIQTPQYFSVSRELMKKSPIAYAAAYNEEMFYRVIQVARDRFDAAICCGSNALYRRSALNLIGGPRQVDASEDSRTGFAMLMKGLVVRYLPIITASGICPDNTYAYFHQQHRWARGRSELVLSKEFLNSNVSFAKKIINISGFLSFIARSIELVFSFQIFLVLFAYSQQMTVINSLIFYPYIIVTMLLYPSMHIIKVTAHSFLCSLVRVYASLHAVIGVVFGKKVAWFPTGSAHREVSTAYKTIYIISYIYLLVYLALFFLAMFSGYVKIEYISILFWVFWNMVLSIALVFMFSSAFSGAKVVKPVIKSASLFEYFYSRKLVPLILVFVASLSSFAGVRLSETKVVSRMAVSSGADAILQNKKNTNPVGTTSNVGLAGLSYTAQKYDFYHKLARQAVRDYYVSNDLKLDRAEMVRTETYLIQEMKLQGKELVVGEVVTFDSKQIASIARDSTLMSSAERLAWSQFKIPE